MCKYALLVKVYTVEPWSLFYDFALLLVVSMTNFQLQFAAQLLSM